MTTTSMLKALAYTQWKHQRVEITMITLAAAVVAPISIWPGYDFESQTAMRLMTASQVIGIVGATLAILSGALLAIRPWILDSHAKHTYALALPVARSQYALLRAATGLSLTLIPAAGFMLGAIFATRAAPPTEWIKAYPGGLGLRFAVAAATAFALAFGLQYGLGRRAARWILITLITVGGFELLGQLTIHTSLTAPLWQLLVAPASPLRIFGSNWALFDV